ncbi:TonB-dependent receptor plug domain-containing protein [Pontiella sp.]|uniref:TonB-dependent receptor plug domain-containing protein n=1 Tax=Pontiella sp. TaxID=2837462 RepID=UPI00356414C3
MKKLIPALFVASCCVADFVDTRTIEYGLREETEVLVNSQGLAQHDLSIRGGSYTGTGISLNGLNLKVPYSAHFNSDLPLLCHLLSAPSVQTGLGNASGHLTGTADYTLQAPGSLTQYSAGIGTQERYQATAIGGGENVGGFIDWEKAHDVDHDANGSERFTGGATLRFLKDDWLLDFVAASQSKEFGAQGYYGIAPDTYAEQSTYDRLLFLGATKGEMDGAYVRTSAAYREFDSEYLIPSTLDASDVRSRYGAFAVEGRTLEIQHIALYLRGDLEHERVSEDFEADRSRGSLLAMPEARFERFALKAGLNTVFQTEESAEWLPQAGVDWFATDNATVYATYSETVQQPDFQTLENNPLLQMQKSQNTELGFRQFLSASLDWRVAGFHRRLENASDWINGAATDLGNLHIAGLDSTIRFYPSENLKLEAAYQWVHKDNDRSGGLYETDYPEHMLNLSAYWKFLDEFAIRFAQTLRLQTDNPARSGSDFGADASLGLHYLPRYAKTIRLSLLVDNLWGSDFEAIPGLEPEPTTVTAGLAVQW